MNKKIAQYFQRRTSGKYIEEIDGLRFFAIFPVLIHHLAERLIRLSETSGQATSLDIMYFEAIPNGKLGVELFFIISGFVISLPLIKNWYTQFPNPIKFDYLKYFLRRLTRLEPPYLLVMLMSFIALSIILTHNPHAFDGTQSLSINSIPLVQSFLVSLVYLHGVVFYTYPRINPPAWSLEIEFQFYILAPILLLGVFYLVKNLPSKKWFIPTLTVAVVLIKLIALNTIPSGKQIFYVMDYIQYFVLGFVLCYLYVSGVFSRYENPITGSIMFLVGIGIFLFTNHLMKDYYPNILKFPLEDRVYITLLSLTKLVGFLTFFMGVFLGGIGRVVTKNTWIATIGGMCYSIYLLHLFILQLGVPLLFQLDILPKGFMFQLIFMSTVLIPVVLICSAIFYVLIEKPCMDHSWPKKLFLWFSSIFSATNSSSKNPIS
ncbi:hypothetical protein BFP72_04035 [Reichenbachiella sp. 5M10]|uniref:acyltransferase family protein n=1 Tax=Reichenbachiella sp. 5M10 TaxID=1889772 RepID=UPI000C154E22|nr:acyltransferase [Reichenbachiella sp. 5M10]PIB34637.1 hypothetical protein BFP72_04035 [Reichenbachiella sp. 5M10]